MKTLTVAMAVLAVALLITLSGPVGTAFADIVIYYDDFSGSSADPLDGTAPDTRPGSETWLEGFIDPTWKADGSIVGPLAAVRNAFLPFVPQSDYVYTLSADMNPNAPAGSQEWFMLGFTKVADPHGFWWSLENYASMRAMVDRGLGNSMTTAMGPGPAGARDFGSVPGELHLKIVLDTRQTLWTAEFILNDTTLRGPEAYTINPDIAWVGFGQASVASGYVDNFSLTSVFMPVWDLTWDGEDSTWSFGQGTDSHWDGGDPGDIPTADDTARVPAGTSTVDDAQTVGSLGIDGSGTVNVAASGNLTVTDSLLVRGGAALMVDGALTAGSVSTDGATTFTAGSTATLGTLSVSGGSLSTSGNLGVEVMEVTAGTVDTTTSPIEILTTMKLGSTSFSIAPPSTFQVSGSDLLSARELILTGGTLAVSGANPAEPLATPDTDLAVTADTILILDTVGAATLGNLALVGDPDPVLAVAMGPSTVSFNDVSGRGTLGGAGGVGGNFSIRGALLLGNTANFLDLVGDLTMEPGSTYEWGLGALGGAESAVAGELRLNTGGSWTLRLVDDGAPLGAVSGDPPVLFDYGSLGGDSIGTPVIDANAVEHWVFTGGVPTVVNDAPNNRIVLGGLEEILALQWKTDADGSYNDPGNWFNQALPDGVDAEANFLGIPTAARTVSADADVTVGSMTFENANSYTIDGPGKITLQASSGTAQIGVQAGDHTVLTPLSVAGDLAVSTEAATSLTLDPAVWAPPMEGDLAKDGPGSLVVGPRLILLGDLDVNGGSMEVVPGVLPQPGGNVTLADGTTLKASGVVNRRVVGVTESTLQADGALAVGVLDDPGGYNFQGHLEVGANMVGLMDADKAQVYETHLGGGVLSSFNGIGLQAVDVFGTLGTHEGWLTGHGTVKGAVRFEVDGANFAAIAGDGPGQEIVLDGVVSGSGWLEWVIMTGLHRPGASAGFTGLGQGTNIGPGATVMGIDGTAGFATPNPAENAARGYDQWFAMFGQHAISGDLTMSLEAPTPGGEWHVPDPSVRYEIFKSFAPQGNPAFAGWYIGWFNNVTLDPSWPNPTEWVWEFDYQDGGLGHGTEPDPGRAFYSATLMVIPEPGTLVLLLSGGLGVLLLSWRRRRRG